MKTSLFIIVIVVTVMHVNAQNPLVVAECDFDGVVNNCEFSFDTSLQNTWQIGTPQKTFFGNAHSAPNAIQTDTINAYPVNNHSEFILKFANNVVDATDWNSTILKFWHKYQTGLLKDTGQISYSLDGGISWLAMVDTYYITGSNGYVYQDFRWDVSLMEVPSISLDKNVMKGISSDWVFSQYSWLWYFSVEPNRDNFTPDTIMVKFSFDSDSVFDNFDGWIIDNISVEKAFHSGIQNQINISANLNLFPNPATHNFNFALSGNQFPQLQQLINQRGEVVKEYYFAKKQA